MNELLWFSQFFSCLSVNKIFLSFDHFRLPFSVHLIVFLFTFSFYSITLPSPLPYCLSSSPHLLLLLPYSVNFLHSFPHLRSSHTIKVSLSPSLHLRPFAGLFQEKSFYVPVKVTLIVLYLCVNAKKGRVTMHLKATRNVFKITKLKMA